MSRFREKMIEFMSDRYGMDQLNNSLMILAVLVALVNLFIPSPIITGCVWLCAGGVCYRSFSRNVSRRRQENDRFLELRKPFHRALKRFARRFREGRNYRFRTCRHCKAYIRLPRKPGKRTIICPKCKSEMKVRILL